MTTTTAIVRAVYDELRALEVPLPTWNDWPAGSRTRVLRAARDAHRAHLSRLGQRGGSVTSEAKIAAARANGAKGGRPSGGTVRA
jgi:hypothetical protein